MARLNSVSNTTTILIDIKLIPVKCFAIFGTIRLKIMMRTIELKSGITPNKNFRIESSSLKDIDKSIYVVLYNLHPIARNVNICLELFVLLIP